MNRPAPNEATRRQIAAARPDTSTWLGANAGSGKTRVLTDRVARLLLAGTDPQSILCVTYTKAAAAEMQNRLFSRLGAWAMLDDDALAEALADLGVTVTPDGTLLAQARRLFAAAIETPGGLKIQTIHAFCSLILRRFPLEAGVTPGFTELDDSAMGEIIGDALDGLATDQPEVFEACAAHVGATDLHALTQAILKHRRALGQAPDPITLAARLDLPDDFGPDLLRARVLIPGTWRDLEEAVPALTAGTANDQKFADRIRLVLPERDPIRIQEALEGAFLTLTGTPRKNLVTKGTRAKHLGLCDALDDLALRVLDGRRLRNGITALARQGALHSFAADLLARIARLKEQRGGLDFEDLIERTHALLHQPGVADWVLYKLDGGIDHVLVDEAQDTAPRQWEVIETLTESFTQNPGADGTLPRTLFVVGDFKQSIYSFQGAEPEAFSRMRTRFAEAHAVVGRKLREESLQHSFRSAPAVLEVVDAVFDGEAREALGGDPVHHIAFKDQLPGRVDLWPPVAQDKEEMAETPWFQPVDTIHAQDDRRVLAGRIADEVARIIAEEALPGPDGPRPVHAGDVLVLVQTRNTLFDAIITACKTRGIDVAGADRLKLEGELAVQDILGLLKFIDLQEDSLSLATALRSPLFGWDEDALHRLAAQRPKGASLWEALRKSEDHKDTLAVLDDLRNASDFLRPYDLIDRLLTRHAGRARLIARLGPEAEDGIDAALVRARAYEKQNAASLTGFLAWMEGGETEIKRQAEGAGRALRVMTVHGAKGLEAPIVILPDTGDRTLDVKGDLVTDADGGVLWKGPKDSWLEVTETAVETAKKAIAAEWQRMLYVAMTRAENWLIVCAAGSAEKDESWHVQIDAALDRMGASQVEMPTGPGARHTTGTWPARPAAGGLAPVTGTEALPGWALDPVAPPAPLVEPVRASGLPGAKALPGEGLPEEEAKRIGTLVHGLLEDLPLVPETDRPAVAATLLARRAPDLPEDARATLASDALGVLASPDLSALFTPDALAEVALSAPLPDGRILRGVIDRLIVTDSQIHAIDYKTNRALPTRAQDVPAGVLAQMGAYAHALGAIYPGRTLRLSILWTANAQLMEIPLPLAQGSFASATGS